MRRVIECPPGHKISQTEYPGALSTMYSAQCECGWRASSSSPGLRNYNIDGHLNDVRKGAVK